MFDFSGTSGDSDANIHLFLEFEYLLMKLSEQSIARQNVPYWNTMRINMRKFEIR